MPDLEDLEARELDSKTRKGLSSEDFAVPSKRKLPIHDAAHVRNALARFNQTQGLTPAEKSAAKARIHRAAKKFGIDVNATTDLPQIAAMKLLAVSLDMPNVQDHPNRMPFTGILTRIDQASDKPPQGSNGKRVLLTKAAAESALDSLLGMGVDLTKDFDGHDAQKKIGLITGAHIDGDAIKIAGFIYAADFPSEALRIHLDQSDLGFSFEARNLAVESMDTDPLVVKSCVFTGAAILMKNDAAYTTTSLAAAAAKEKDNMDEIMKAVTAALSTALDPFKVTLDAVKASQEAQAAAIEEMKKTPQVVHAVAATVAKVEPHANRLEAAADQMEKDGIGLHDTQGHVRHLHRMAAAMRAEAAMGKMPSSYHDAGSYWASGDRSRQQDLNPQPAAVKIEETAEFKALKASADAQAIELKASKDASAALDTKLTDLTNQIKTLRPDPQRKTISPEIQSILARAGLTAPEAEGGTIPIGQIDAALAKIPGIDLTQRMHLKTALARGGVIAPNG